MGCEFVRFPVVATAKDVLEGVFGGVAFIPHGLERRCGRWILATVKAGLALARIDGASASVLAVVFAENGGCGVHVWAPAFCPGFSAHDGVQEYGLGMSPGTSEVESFVETGVADFDDGVVENVAPIVRVLRCRNVAAVSRHHELGAFEENVTATADKVNGAIDFATFPVGAAFLGVVGVLSAQEAHVLVDELIACVLLQGNLPGGVARVIGASVLQGDVLHVHVLVAGEVYCCCGANAFGVGRVPNNGFVNGLPDDGNVGTAERRFAVFVAGELGDVVFTIRDEENKALGFACA